MFECNTVSNKLLSATPLKQSLLHCIILHCNIERVGTEGK